MDNKVAVKAVLVTLGAAFVLLSVVEWKKFVDLMPTDDGTLLFFPQISPDNASSVFCSATPNLAGTTPAPPPSAGMSLDQCQKIYGSHVPWGQAIKSFVYSWIGVGLLVAAFVKPKGVAGGW